MRNEANIIKIYERIIQPGGGMERMLVGESEHS